MGHRISDRPAAVDLYRAADRLDTGCGEIQRRVEPLASRDVEGVNCDDALARSREAGQPGTRGARYASATLRDDGEFIVAFKGHAGNHHGGKPHPRTID